MCVLLASSSQAAVDARFDQTIPVSARVQIDVLTESGDISVHAGDSGKLEIHGRIHADEGSNDPNLEGRVQAIQANPAILRQGDGTSVQIGHFNNPKLTRDISISYDIVVPADAQLRTETNLGEQTVEGIQGPLYASSGSGNLQIAHIGGDTHASSGSGEINLRDIRGLVHVRAGTGTIRAATIGISRGSQDRKVSVTTDAQTQTLTVLLRDLGSVNTEIITGSGDVEVDDVAGGLQVTTGSGAIRVSGNPSADWRLETGSGVVRVQLAESASFALLAHTSSGIIEAQHTIANRDELGLHDLRAKVGKGGPTVDLKTASGNIEIE